jgi:hypothetical protein
LPHFPHKTYGTFGLWRYAESYISAKEKKKSFERMSRERFGIVLSSYKNKIELINTNYSGYKFGNIYLVGETGGFASPIMEKIFILP